MPYTCTCVREEDNHSETLWANIDAACYRNNGQTCRDNAMPWCSPRTLYSRCVCLCLYSRLCEFLCMYACAMYVGAHVCMHIIVARMRSLDRRMYVYARNIPFAIRPRVLQRCFRSERARTRAVNLSALRQHTVDANDRRTHSRLRRRKIVPMFSLCRRIRRGHGAKGVVRWNLFNTDISRARATVIAFTSPAYVCARDVNGIFVLTLLARSFVRKDCLPGTIDCRWAPPPVYPPRTHLEFLSERKPRVMFDLLVVISSSATWSSQVQFVHVVIYAHKCKCPAVIQK